MANSLGAGFLEKVYKKALLRELGIRGVRAESQVPFSVVYKGYCVGDAWNARTYGAVHELSEGFRDERLLSA